MTRTRVRLMTTVLAGTACAAVTAAAAVPALGGGGERAARAATSADAATGSTATGAQARGKLVDARFLRRMSAGEVREWLKGEGFDATAVRHGVDVHRLTYRTVDAHGRPTAATGLAVLPRSGDRRLRTVSYAHGTTSHKPDAPSRADDVWGSGPAVTYASAGFAAVAPDYLGLGFGPGVHPWKDVPSETTASMDLLRAARAFAPRAGRTLERDVMVTGFSQGASAALGLARELQDGGDPWFRLRAVAPISGAYDFSGAQIPAMLRGDLDPKMSVAYVSYLLTSWNRIHGGLYGTPGEVFEEPYASRVEKLFDSTTPGRDMLEGLPGKLGDLLTPRGFALLREPTPAFAEALRVDAEVCTAWTPRVPIRLYKISADEQATTANTDSCVAAFEARGLRAPVVDVGERTYGGSRHLGANLAGTALIVRWFDALR